ncbi:hypothetical protein [Streptomyces sp. GESEQ-35]|uniref:hypothetical protein n=1 Tax=Streptomyces sp. GESEQ-35 TaxID=2812657 RepID=UPI001B3326AC|nr:hypothetical protein [Streptomyces sp. GESEQ-35]
MRGRAARAVGALTAVLLLAGCGAGAQVTREARAGAAPPSAGPATETPPTSPPPSAPAPSPTPERTQQRPGDSGRPTPSASAGRSVRGPDLSRRTPSATARRTASAPAAPKATPKAAPEGRPTRTTIRIGTWSSRVVPGGQDEVDACRDAVQWAGPTLGTENGYEMSTSVIVGHDFCGFDRFATLPVGTRVTIASPRGTWAYQVYANYITPGRGAPAAGLYWGDLTLQSCVGPDTGFSYLMRI